MDNTSTAMSGAAPSSGVAGLSDDERRKAAELIQVCGSSAVLTAADLVRGHIEATVLADKPKD